MAGRFKVLTDEHWSRAHVQAAREAGWDVTRVTPGRLVQVLERLASEEAPFAGVIRFAKQEER